MASRRLEVAPARAHRLRERYADVRAATAGLAAPLSAEDQLVQSMPDASPTKWHLAHTTWFFETFVLSRFVPGYRVVNDQYAYLFNSYYEAVGPRQPRPHRGALTRPSLDEGEEGKAEGTSDDVGLVETSGDVEHTEVRWNLDDATHRAFHFGSQAVIRAR